MERTWNRSLDVTGVVAGIICTGCLAIAAFTLKGGTLIQCGIVAGVLALLAVLAVVLLRLEGVIGPALVGAMLLAFAAMVLRVACLDYASLDYQDFLAHWYDYFKANGGFKAMADSVGNYNVPYLYFMAAISYLDMPDLYMIKLFSVLFDVLLAWAGYRLTAVLRGERDGDAVPIIAFALLLVLPTVVLNGAYWGQCDSLYGGLTLLALGQALKGKNKSSVILLAVAFSFKLQTIFLIPLWGVLWFSRKMKFWELLLFPATYIVTIVPALIMGKPLGDILGVYVGQVGEYGRLTLNAPSIYQFIPYGMEVNESLLSKLGIAAAAVVVFALLGLALWLGKRLDTKAIMAMAAVLAVGVPFLLPHMHERYFFLADVVFLCWACANWRNIPAAILVCLSSLRSYLVYLLLEYNYIVRLGGMMFPMGVEVLAMLVAFLFALVMMVLEVVRCARLPKEEKAE